MTIGEVCEGIATALDMNCLELWADILNNTIPGHYGFEDLEFMVAISDIWVTVPERTFTFRNGLLSFVARIGSSGEEGGVDMNVRKTLSGSGSFDFDGQNKVRVKCLQVNEPIDLYE
ncbi:MAG: hypothetical protein ACOYM3_17835 [Terrimicrobiaceae bacterium]